MFRSHATVHLSAMGPAGSWLPFCTCRVWCIEALPPSRQNTGPGNSLHVSPDTGSERAGILHGTSQCHCQCCRACPSGRRRGCWQVAWSRRSCGRRPSGPRAGPGNLRGGPWHLAVGVPQSPGRRGVAQSAVRGTARRTPGRFGRTPNRAIRPKSLSQNPAYEMDLG